MDTRTRARALGGPATTTLALVALLAGAGCGGPVENVCAGSFIGIGPADTAVTPGESFVPRVTLTSCGGRERLSDVLAFHSADTAVVAVDRASGRVTARSPGTATVTVSGRTSGAIGELTVRVR